ncbi:MAG: helix-turn-helix domain-containing protein [Clostridia bacterium]|nr:helix-turn-helix domain-containing protein [Clostridia bacterium]
MDLEKTGKLIAKKRAAQSLTQAQPAEKLKVTSQAVSLWETGNRYPDADQQLRIYKVLGINPIELLTGEEMWDKELKKKIEEYIRNCEHADTMFRFIDDNGEEQVLNLIDFDVVATDEKGHLTGEWVPFEDWQEMNKKKKKA